MPASAWLDVLAPNERKELEAFVNVLRSVIGKQEQAEQVIARTEAGAHNFTPLAAFRRGAALRFERELLKCAHHSGRLVELHAKLEADYHRVDAPRFVDSGRDHGNRDSAIASAHSAYLDYIRRSTITINQKPVTIARRSWYYEETWHYAQHAALLAYYFAPRDLLQSFGRLIAFGRFDPAAVRTGACVTLGPSPKAERRRHKNAERSFIARRAHIARGGAQRMNEKEPIQATHPRMLWAGHVWARLAERAHHSEYTLKARQGFDEKDLGSRGPVRQANAFVAQLLGLDDSTVHGIVLAEAKRLEDIRRLEYGGLVPKRKRWPAIKSHRNDGRYLVPRARSR